MEKNARIQWVALGYSLPMNPSKNRVYVWRKLKEMGAVPYSHGVAVLPKSSKRVSELVILCEKIKSLGGDASVLEMQFVTQADENRMVQKFREQSASECDKLLESFQQLLGRILSGQAGTREQRGEAFKRLVREYRKVKSRSHFGLPRETELERLIDAVFERLAGDAMEFADYWRRFLEKARS